MQLQMPDEEAEVIARAYDASPNRIVALPTERFLSDIWWRVYTEWCLSTPAEFRLDYDGSAFERYVADEIHYDLVRQGFRWSWNEGRFHEINEDGLHIGKAYPETRVAVLEALTESAIDFFKSCKDYTYPLPGDRTCLMRSLEPWLV